MLPLDQTFFVCILIASLVVSCLLPRIAVAVQIHLVQIGFSLSFGFLLFGAQQMGIVLFAALLMYFWTQHASRFFRPIICSTVVWLSMFITLLWLHYSRPVDTMVHVSGCFMLMTIKYTSHQHKPASLLEWLGWTFFVPSFFTGPTLSLEEYQNWLKASGEKTPEPGLDRLPSPSWSDVFIESLWYAPFAILGTSIVPIAAILDFDPSVGTVHRLLYGWIALWCIKCRYYLIWGIAEASFIGSGASWFVWHRGRNANVQKIECAHSVRDITENWNRCSAMWLKTGVYQPMNAWLNGMGWSVDQSARLAVMVTSLTSATWHGFSAGYYLTFGCTFVCTIISRLMHKEIELAEIVQRSALLRSLYKVTSVVWLNVILLTVALPFQLHTFDMSWKAWQSLNFIGHMWAAIALIAVLLVSNGKQRRQLAAKKE